MELIIGIFFIIIGVIMLLKPKIMWKISDSWKTKTKAEPSKFYITLIRIVGCILIVAGIFVVLQR